MFIKKPSPKSNVNYKSTSVSGTSSWISQGGYYYTDIVHNLGKRPVNVQCVRSDNWKAIIPSDIEYISTSTVRIWMTTNTIPLTILCMN